MLGGLKASLKNSIVKSIHKASSNLQSLPFLKRPTRGHSKPSIFNVFQIYLTDVLEVFIQDIYIPKNVVYSYIMKTFQILQVFIYYENFANTSRQRSV